MHEHRATRPLPLIGTIVFSIGLTLIGYRLFVDAAAAVLYNADERIPEATEHAWIWACVWGFGNGVLGYWAYRSGHVTRKSLVKSVAAALLVLDLSFLVVLGARPGGDDLGTTAVVALIAAGLLVLAWRKPTLGGSVLMVGGALLAFGAAFGSASYEGEAEGLLFDEDVFAIVSFGLVPFASGLAFVVSKLFTREKAGVRPTQS